MAFANVDITGVKYNTTSSDDGIVAPANSNHRTIRKHITYPITITTPVPSTGSTTYTDQKDFLTRYPNSTWNVNTATIQVATNTSTVSPAGTLSGGPSNQTVNPGATAGVGAFATVPRLVK